MAQPVRLVTVVSDTPLPPLVEPSRPPSRRRWLVLALAGLLAACVSAAVIHAVESSGGKTSLSVPANTVGVIDPVAHRVTATIRGLGDRPVGIAYGDGSLWVASAASDVVTQIDPATHASQTYTVGLTPTGIAFLAGQVWVTDSGDGTLCEITPGSPRCVATPPAGNGPLGVISADGSLFVADSADHAVVEISKDGKITHRVSAGSDPTALTFWDHKLWVTNESAGAVTPIDLRTLQAENPIPVGQGPDSITAGDGRLYVANHLSNTLSVIDPTTLTVTRSQSVPLDPESVLVRGSEVWVACRGADEIVVLDAHTLQPRRVIPTGGAPGTLAADPVGQVYVSSLTSQRQAKGGTLVVGTGDLQLTNVSPAQRQPSLDPASWRTWNQQAWDMLWLMGDGLVTYKRVGGADGDTLVPDLAQQLPTVSGRGTTYTFTLRPDLHYSNGAPVKASDIRYGIERQLIQNPPNARVSIPQLYAAVKGAVGCTKSHCRLAEGIVTNDQARTVTFHLTHPQPDFLYLLALPFAYAVPATTPLSDQFMKPIPMTGPYILKSYSLVSQAAPGSTAGRAATAAAHVEFVRNPRFRQWSADAQPQGYPDRIVWTLVKGANRMVSDIQRGTVDWTYGPPPPGRIAELGTHYTAQLHPGLIPDTTFMAATSGVYPLGNPRVRLAIDDAIDRSQIAQLNGSSYQGGQLLSIPTCQILPPNYPGYSPTCPYSQTGTPTGAPKLTQALRLVRASHTAGAHIVVTALRSDPGTQAVARYLVGVLTQLGYHAKVRYDIGECASDALSICGWLADYPTPGDFLSLGLCSFESCPAKVNRQIRAAYNLQSADLARAYQLFGRADAEITRRGSAWIPIYTNVSPGFTSRRVANFQWNPMMGVLLDQLTVGTHLR
jgi:YVTN family beta-propeller protein